jgi:hypothetical protein
MQEPDTDSNSPTPQTPLTEETRARLESVRRTMLQLHKVLLNRERHTYEQVYGRTLSGGELLQLLIHDEWFAWLRPISELVVRIDEEQEADEPMTEQGAIALLLQVRGLLLPSDENEEFSKKYQLALQQDPASTAAHAEIARLLPS